MRQLNILFKNVVRDAMGITVIMSTELLLSFNVDFDSVTQQSTLYRIFRNQ